jgi:predicted RND superfamily exporter protein
VLLVAVLLLPLTIIGARQAIHSNANDVRDWLPSQYPETRDYRWFHQHFGSEDFVVVSWPGCLLDDPLLARFAEQLRQLRSSDASATETPRFRRVTTGSEIVKQLTSAPVSLDRDSAIERLQGTIIGPDGDQTCAVITLSDMDHRNLRNTMSEIKAIAVAVGVPAHDVHLGGPPAVNAAIDEASSQSLVRLAGLAAIIGLAIAWLCFRTMRLTMIVFVISAYSAALSLATVPLFGVPLNAILITMVPLVYVAAMSGAIHLSNYYLDHLRLNELGAKANEDAVRKSIRHASLPLGLATATTAIGLLSLWYSDLAPIRLFGLFSALGVGIALSLQVILLPALLSLWPATAPAKAEPAGFNSDESSAERLSPRWQGFANFVIARHAWICGACLALLAVAAIGLTRVETSIQIMRLFAPRTPILTSYAWLEQHLGALVPMEVVIRFDAANKQGMLQRLQLIRGLQKSISESPQVGGSISAATFAPEIDLMGGSLRSFVINRRLTQARPRLIESGYLVHEEDEELWRIGVRVTAGGDLDYGMFQQKLREHVEPVLTRAKSDGANGVSAIYTGAIPIIYKARRSLLNGLAMGFGTDVLLVVVAVTMLLRHWSNGLLLLLTSIFPMMLIFGLMGWLDVVVDIGSVMTPCVALGVTIDDVIHFVLWFRRGIERGDSLKSAVELAYAGCGRAMIQSWGVIGLGLSAFALSSFIPTFRFGALMIGLLTVGLAGNLFFLPALLAGPLGRIIATRVASRQG